MAIYLFTDFGAADLYVGQVEAVLDRYAPHARVIHLLNEAPAFDIRASAHLLAALAAHIPRGSVVLGVVDPGVGSERSAAVVRADGRWYVGPDNGLFSVLAARSPSRSFWRIARRLQDVSPTFHGRDLFAPIAADIAADGLPDEKLEGVSTLEVNLGEEDWAAVVYVDHYGNAMTGIRASRAPVDGRLRAGGVALTRARTFSDVAPGHAFWYENSIGLVEIAANRAHCASLLGLEVGAPVEWAA